MYYSLEVTCTTLVLIILLLPIGVRASPILNCKYQICLKFTIWDQGGSDNFVWTLDGKSQKIRNERKSDLIFIYLFIYFLWL